MKQKKHHMYSYISNLIFENMGKEKKISIFDFGCGSGAIIDHLPKNKISAYVGADINEFSIKSAKKRYKNNKKFSFFILNKDSLGNLKLLDTNHYDAIIAVGVLQYLSKKELNTFMKIARKYLKKDGNLILSTNTDHKLYIFINPYSLFLTHNYVNRKEMIKLLINNNFSIQHNREVGLILTPFLSNFTVFFFDALDKFIFRTKGEIGLFGNVARSIAGYIIKFEYLLPIDFGSILYIKSQKK